MNSLLKTPVTSLMMIGALSASAMLTPVQAASLQQVGPLAPGADCSAHDVNSSGYTVGACTGTPEIAWLNNPLLASVSILGPLVPGKSCSADGIAGIGSIVGNCDNASNLQTGVTWSLSSTSTAQPLQTLLTGLRTVPTAQNETFVVGQSVSLLNLATPAIWVSSLGTARRIGPLDGGCQPVGVQGRSLLSTITIAMNCPRLLGGENAYSVKATSFNATYIRQLLPIPSGDSNCSAIGINSNGQLAGTCYDAAGNGKATFWSSTTSTPTTLPLTGATSTVVSPPNSSGQMAVLHTASGQATPALWDPLANTVTDIPALPSCTQNVPVAIADNARVLLNCAYSTGNVQAFTWSLATGSVSLGLYPGSPSLTCGAISPNGSFASCVARDNSAHLTAVQASTLP